MSTKSTQNSLDIKEISTK
uniref:Uncharacterized protein n=1 Tax=Rhizophora mucronata TaxID=61149 RepID=A0A2P2MZW2_RHIMU